MTFVGEFAIDHGGPCREFFRLFSSQCSETFFRGKAKYFDVNAAAVQVNNNHMVMIHIVSLLHGGPELTKLATGSELT